MADEERDGNDPPDPERKRLFERAIPELVKKLIERAVESGVEKLSEQPEALKNLVGDLRVPKEVLSEVLSHVDDTKNGLYRVVAKEIRDVLEQTQFADEIAKVLTKLSFEIKTEIRFVPNDRAKELESQGHREDGESDGSERPGIKPKVTSEVTVRDRSKEGRR
ncbi:MAG: hypothetical protein U0414_28325 [Polyangiaceae bacterium]